MKRANVTFGQLDAVLRSFGFSPRPGNNTPPGSIYEHKNGALVALPAFTDDERVYEHHVQVARWEVEDFGIADKNTFDRRLKKAM